MERDGKTYCDKHGNVETALRCSRCEAYICPDCAVLTPVGYRCRSCGLERSATHTITPLQLAIGCASGVVLGFAATALVVSVNIGFFLIFAGAVAGSVVGRLVSRTIGRKNSVVVGGATALGFIAGVAWTPIRAAWEAGGQISANDALSLMFNNPWPLVFACVAAGIAWVQLK